MTPSEALQDIQGYASANRIVFTFHAERRAAERGVTHADVRCALMTARRCAEQPNQTWKVLDGTDTGGDDLTVVVAVEAGVVVITVF